MWMRLFSALALLPIVVGCGGSITIKLSEDTLQAAVDQYFPVKSTDLVKEELPVEVTLSEPDLILQDGSDRIALKVKVDGEGAAEVPAELPAGPPTGEAEGAEAAQPSLPGPPGSRRPPGPQPGGTPPFSPPTGTPQPPKPEVPAPPPQNISGTVTASGKLDYKADEGAFYLLEPKIDEIDLGDLPKATSGPARQAVEKALNKYFAEKPIYTLSEDDNKSKAAKMLLKSVKVEGGQLHIELGP